LIAYPEDFAKNRVVFYNPPISARYPTFDDELTRQAGWTPQQSGFNYVGGQAIGFGLSVWIPAGIAYSSSRVAVTGAYAAVNVVDDVFDDTLGGAGKSVNDILGATEQGYTH
jgi:hypothetical protein